MKTMFTNVTNDTTVVPPPNIHSASASFHASDMELHDVVNYFCRPLLCLCFLISIYLKGNFKAFYFPL